MLSRSDEPMESLFIRACRGDPVERVPIWIMRQAGRYLPEYMKVKERYDFATVKNHPAPAR